MAIQIKTFEFNMFGLNTYVVWDQSSHQGMIIDPGMIDSSEEHMLADFIASNKISVKYLINTHLHLDHTFGDEFAKNKYNVDLLAHADDIPLGLMRTEQCRRFGIRAHLTPIKPDRMLSNNDTVTLGDTSFKILHVPGHSPGSIALYDSSNKCVFAGDVIFRGSIGRTDLEMGNHATLIHSIRTKILTLPPETVIYPGHGPKTTIEAELIYNPFI